MAGTYLHLLLAHEAFGRLAAEAGFGAFAGSNADSDVAASFNAGVLGPDIGYYPGGPRGLSEAIHQYHTADLVRRLHELAEQPTDVAFAAGWALHVYTDLAVHPQIDAKAARLQVESPMPAGTDSWHKAVEWGLDCQTLESTPIRLWRSPLGFSMDGTDSGIVAQAATQFFDSLADPFSLAEGAKSTTRWVRRLAPILMWTGGCRRSDRGNLCRISSAVLNPLARRLATRFAADPQEDDAAAILSPLRDDEEWLTQVRAMATASIDDFIIGWRQQHQQLENRHLSSAELIHDPYVAP